MCTCHSSGVVFGSVWASSIISSRSVSRLIDVMDTPPDILRALRDLLSGAIGTSIGAIRGLRGLASGFIPTSIGSISR